MQKPILNLYFFKRYSVGLRFFLSTLLGAFFINCAQAEFLTLEEGGTSWVLVAQDQAPVYQAANLASTIEKKTSRLDLLEVIEQPQNGWFEVYLDHSHQQTGFIHQASLFKYFYKNGDLVVITAPGNKTILTNYQEADSNTAVEIYNKNKLIDRIESPSPISRYDFSSGAPVQLSGVDFIYSVHFGVPACAEPSSDLYFIWDGKALKLLETGCTFCEDADYAIKEIILPPDVSHQDTILVKYSWGQINDYDGIDIDTDLIEHYRWDGTQLKFIERELIKHKNH